MGDFIRSLLRSTSSHHRPWQLSAAVALGMLCGLLPKINLTFCILGMICCVLPMHLPLAALACLLCSFSTTALASTAGHVGIQSLTHPLLIDTWLTIDALPWIPWLGINNTVIHGSLLIGLALLLPVYLITKPISNRLAPQPKHREPFSADKDFEQEIRPAVSRLEHIPKNERSVDVSFATCNEDGIDEQTCQELENLLATCNGEEASEMSTAQVAQRAAQMAQFVDDLLTSCQTESSAIIRHETGEADDLHPKSQHFTTASPSLASTRDTREAILNSTSTLVRPVSQVSVRHSKARTEAESAKHHIEHTSHDAAQPAGIVERKAPHSASEVQPAETLRYLLHHLKAIKDKV